MVDGLHIHVDTNPDGAATLTVAGEIDMHSAPQFRHALAQAATSHPRLIVDLTAAAYLDSAGIAPIVEISQLDRVATISVRQ